jgi:hypothetical protein
VEICCRPSCPQNPRLALPRLLHAETFRTSERGAGRRREICRGDEPAGIPRSQQESSRADPRTRGRLRKSARRWRSARQSDASGRWRDCPVGGSGRRNP